MCSRKLIIFAASSAVFLIALVSGPPSFDSTDGAEFAVCGSLLQIAHSPGYPLFLMLVRLFAMVFSPLYGHLRLLNCFLGATAVAVGTAALGKAGVRFFPSLAGSVLFLTAAPVMSQFNCLEVYPLSILLVLCAMALKDSPLSSYASGMAFFGGHPVSVLSAPLFLPVKRRWLLLPAVLIPATLFLYIPIRASACHIAHYGHPDSLKALLSYFTMYSGRLGLPSTANLIGALSTIGIPGGAVFLLLAFAGGKYNPGRDIPAILAALFLASYTLPDPAGQMWILLLPLSVRCAAGIQFLFTRSHFIRLLTAAFLLTAIVSGVAASNRSNDDIAMRWTTDVMSSLPANSIYRPVAHDTYYAAYATYSLGFRPDLILSDPFGNYFEFSPPGQIPPVIGERTVHISRVWNRSNEFSLHGLIFSPVSFSQKPVEWSQMTIFQFRGSSPDPIAMDIVSEAWARRMIQEDNPALADSFYRNALEFSATTVTRRRIERIREIF
jgi:hypothetical protein